MILNLKFKKIYLSSISRYLLVFVKGTVKVIYKWASMQIWQCPSCNGSVWSRMNEISMFMILKTNHFHFKFLYWSDLRIYTTGKHVWITHLILEKRQYRCESGISSFTWRVTWITHPVPLRLSKYLNNRVKRWICGFVLWRSRWFDLTGLVEMKKQVFIKVTVIQRLPGLTKKSIKNF